MASVDSKYSSKRDKKPWYTLPSCPSPDELILLSDGSQKRAGDLTVGDTVKTRHEETNEIDNFAVSYVEIIPNTKRCKLTFEFNSLVCSYSHKLLVGTDWKTAEDLIFGDVVSGQAFLGTVPVADGDVVLITVEDAHTYIVNGLQSHNKRPAPSPSTNPRLTTSTTSTSTSTSKTPRPTKSTTSTTSTSTSTSKTPRPTKSTTSTTSTPTPGTQKGSFDFKKIMDSFYEYQPKEKGDATDLQKQAYQGNIVQSVLDSQLAQQLGQFNSGLAQDNMTHQADLEQRNQSGLMADEFAYGMAGMDAQFQYGEKGSQNQHERDLGMLSATGEEQRLNLSAQGDQDRLGQIVMGEQARLTNDLNNKSSEAIAAGRYSADTTIASTQADASKYGSKQAAAASKYGSKQAASASKYGSKKAAAASIYGSKAAAEASKYGAKSIKDASIYGSTASKDASIYGSTASKDASMYGSDRSVDVARVNAQGTIDNTRATGDETRKTMGTEQQLKAKERAGMHKYARGTARAM